MIKGKGIVGIIRNSNKQGVGIRTATCLLYDDTSDIVGEKQLIQLPCVTVTLQIENWLGEILSRQDEPPA